jgi:hypothetical protein
MRLILSAHQVRLSRLRAQRLVPSAADRSTAVVEVARAVCGIQAQDQAAATLAVRPRSADLVAQERPPSEPLVHLLPGFDTYLLGYRRRDLAVAPRHARRVHPGGGLLRPVLLVDGLAASTWRSRQRRGGLEIIVDPFETLSQDVRASVEREVRDVARFLGTTATLEMRAPG